MAKKMDELFGEVDSRYALVVAVAKRAREISEKADEDKVLLSEKPVVMAIDELKGELTKLVDADSIVEKNNGYFDELAKLLNKDENEESVEE
ncbi:MAG: DNA-directed RNA polymerase subunit omega [Clostridia bacterium]|nr:DNA-directed RNA polymerase subunit omega [Clostridia bacterium]